MVELEAVVAAAVAAVVAPVAAVRVQYSAAAKIDYSLELQVGAAAYRHIPPVSELSGSASV